MDSSDSPSPPQGPSSSNNPPEDNPPNNDKANDDPAATKAKAKKRTKTGCLTCRKRRIKCDEARPTCANCIKSKRHCEGYNQRVIFKDPLGAFGSFGPLAYPQPSPEALIREQQAAQQKSSSQSLQIIAPKPPSPAYYPGIIPQFSSAYPSQFPPGAPLPLNPLNPAAGLNGSQLPTGSGYQFFTPKTSGPFHSVQWRQEQQQQQQQPPPATIQPPFPNLPPAEPHFLLQQYQPTNDGFIIQNPQHVAPSQTQGAPLEPDVWADKEAEEYEYETDMEDSDDEDMIVQTRQIQLNSIVSQRLNDRYDSSGFQPRTFAVHAEHVLATYEPSPANSPLNDKQIAAVFWHFVNVTGPAISMYERYPFDGTTYLQGSPVKTRQHIWTYTLPVLSLTHPALLQAILAIGSLQIAKLKLVPPTASLKHYHLSLRRIARNVGLVSKKTQSANLAAILILAFYEVWSSDHGKWCKHLLGGRWIIKDIPFPDMSRKVMDIKRRLRKKKVLAMESRLQQTRLGDDVGPFSTFGVFDHVFDQQPDPLQGEVDPLYHDWDLIDVPLLNAITGSNLDADTFGFVPEEHSRYPRSPGKLTERDLDHYETLSDLYWWYCKMDVYQSVLGGTRLFMNYDLWTQCPPRAPMGRSDAIYGTYDHLILVMGRLTEYQSRDLSRKRRFFKARGTFGPTGAPPGTFPGMMPASEKVQHPMGFSPPRDDPNSPGSNPEEQDLDQLTASAHQDWAGIQGAFEAFRNHLGPEFEPLEPDLHPMSMSPFGPALRYRTYSIAGIWMNYYMGMIILHRSHPQMPPVAMMAGPMSAQQTMGYALKIAQIAHGLEENVGALSEVSTLVSAAFIESAFCLFVAGIQYQSTEQRVWLIRYLNDITRLTGWESGREISNGLENAWWRAAANGRGPPWARTFDIEAQMPGLTNPGEKRRAHSPRRLVKRIQEIGDEKTWVVAKEDKANYAMGLLGVQEDLEKLDLDSAEKDE
ncbi:hypothetical protein PFICI_05184 [Pestalotiopsis fici W106-1]|uniref:Zn(2)-C6 fungal-type domain-containing protein n=1 Tax=Pestalotiopsis fici (strain W106-1 / CGMCC3.15140) TaxID=1229662 RepID=W3XB49_PESFW|nr:uncharacterized protein PFICI_05184 [Pestalotiopsis fici W106-1]ETS83308.1 hypothetical protein PFICI_05184 [Pestalotiopsis fici W106-1]